MNKLVARFRDGRVVKGTTLDFSPAKDHFHVSTETPSAETAAVAIHTEDLKALFFVKDFAGDPRHVEKKEFESPPPPGARRVMAAFKDGEVLVGTTSSYQPDLPGFFLVPADVESNIVRCFVVATATREVRLL
jgi:hypothetical protein